MATDRAPRVRIDPGHYAGYNRGNYPGYFEGNQMWRLGLYLQAALRKRGIVADLTKSSCEEDVPLVTRGRMAEGYDDLISMHSNACGDPAVDRVVAIYMVDDNCGPIDEESKELAKLMAETVAKCMGARCGWEIYTRKGAHDRDGDGCKDDYYGVLRGAHTVGTAAIILEHGFHTNAGQAEWLMSDSNLRMLAEAEAKALEGWYRKKGFKWAVSTTDPIKKEENDMFNPVKPGDKGEEVKKLQRLLKVLGHYGGEIDGSYGPATKEAVKKFQRSVGLDADGVAGEMTVEALARAQLFEDVPTGAWYAEAVTEAAALGLMEGVGGGKFEPERPVTRGELAAVLARMGEM